MDAGPLAIVEGVLPPVSCYSQGHVGTYSGYSLYAPSWDCVASAAVELSAREDVSDVVDSIHFATVPEDTNQLVWVSEAALEPSILEQRKPTFPWEFMDARLHEAVNVLHFPEQELLGNVQHYLKAVEVLYRTDSASLIALRGPVPPGFALDYMLAPIHRATVIPYPLSPLVPVPSNDVVRVRNLLTGLKYNASIARLVNVLSVAQMNLDVSWLTGEATRSHIESRHSFHPDTIKAANWIKARIEATGAKCQLKPFSEGFAPNVICRYKGTEDTDELVLVGAHYDSRGSFGSTRAPGGDDDGSGTTSILSIARAIGTTGISFKKNVELCLFAGEEQGLVGSRAYAGELRKADANIILMIHADMVAYRKPGESPQLGLPNIIGTPEVTQLVANISALYSPELEVGFTPACCSDHQSFHEQGFAASMVFERAGPIADPMYHNSGDLSQREGYDFWQLRSIAKVQFATLLHAAGFEGP